MDAKLSARPQAESAPAPAITLRTLDELRASLRSIKSLSNTIDEKPSSLLFGKDSSGNPTPRAPRGNR